VDDVQSWVGMTVTQVLAPGKLRAVEFVCRHGTSPSRVVLELQYSPGLFSPARTWSEELVGQQKVVGVREPGRGGY
jgi:hypothetical protein